jgi:hypothetical protein
MSRTKNRIVATLTTALVAAALAPSASVAYQDLRSPDARDAALASQARSYQDLRSPDARDAGQRQPSPSPTPTGDSTGTDWGDVGIVAGGVVMLIALGGLVLFGRRRGSRKERVAVVSS